MDSQWWETRKIRIIGDVHGKFQDYFKILEDCDHSVQVGDLGFDYSELSDIEPTRHKFVGGNHDNYDEYDSILHSLPNYGTWSLNDIDFYFVRGSSSIDLMPRVRNYFLTGEKTWWYEEELSDKELEMAIEEYSFIKPQVVITHDCPSSIKNNFKSDQVMRHFGWPTEYSCRTQQALSVMFAIHKPKLWFFGHWHRTWDKEIDGTHFFCINELDYLDLNGKLEVTRNGEVIG